MQNFLDNSHLDFPKSHNKSIGLRNSMKNDFKSYLRLMSQISTYQGTYVNSVRQLRPEVTRMCAGILQSFDLYMKGFPGQAY